MSYLISAFTMDDIMYFIEELFEYNLEVVIVLGGLLVAIIALSIIYGSIKKKRKNAKQKVKKVVKVLPDIKKLLGFNPYEEVKTENATGDFYAIASSTASFEDALELKVEQKKKAEEKKAAIEEELKEVEEKQITYNEIMAALKNELTYEKSKKRKKSKDRILDIESEIEKNTENVEDCNAEIEFCAGKIAMCNDALEHIQTQISSLEVSMTDKREELNSIENKNGATYESVKLYEKGMKVVKEFPKIKEPLLAYIRARLKVEEHMQNYNALAAENNLLKTQLRQLTIMFAQNKNASPDFSKKINQKNKEITENVEKINSLKEKIEVVSKETETCRNMAVAAASECGIKKEDFICAQDSLIAYNKHSTTGERLDADIAKAKVKLTVLQKEYLVEHKKYEKINKKDIDKKTESSRRVSDILNKISDTKKEIFRIENFKEEYPKMSPAAFFRGGDFSEVLSDGKSLRKNVYHAEIEKVKNEYVETIKNSTDATREETILKQRQLLERLESLEKKIYAEKTVLRTRAITRQFEDEFGVVNQRKIKVVQALEVYKNEIPNIDSIYAAREYREKLRRFASTLSEEDLADSNINGIIKNCLEEAKIAGEKAQSSWR